MPQSYIVAFQINRHQLHCLNRIKEFSPATTLGRKSPSFHPNNWNYWTVRNLVTLDSVFKPLPPSAELTLDDFIQSQYTGFLLQVFIATQNYPL